MKSSRGWLTKVSEDSRENNFRCYSEPKVLKDKSRLRVTSTKLDKIDVNYQLQANYMCRKKNMDQEYSKTFRSCPSIKK